MRTILRTTAFLCAIFAATTRAYAADILVPSGQPTINAALAVAVAGDVIRIAAGTYNECIVLPNKGTLATPITLRADTADSNLPAAGVRVNPATHGAVMPILRAANNGCPTLKTATSARDYVIGPGLKFGGTPYGYNPAIMLGMNDSTQNLESHQPRNIIVDRIWIKGDRIEGLKGGVDLNGANITVRNSYIEDVKGLGQDAVGLRCFNGSGPITIYNNYVSAAGYGFICGGDQVNMMTLSEPSASTTTSATLANIRSRTGLTHTVATLKVGQRLAILTNSGTMRYHPYVVSCGTSTPGATCTSNNITFTAIPVAPDTGTGSDISWGEITNGITIRRNYWFKPLEWMNSIMVGASNVTTTPSTASGSLAAGTYYYRVVSMVLGYHQNWYNGPATTEVSGTLSATGQITVNWTADPDATKYRVYRTTTAGTYAGYIEVTTNSLVDTGQALTGTSAIPSRSKWVVKDAFEFKWGLNVQVDSNIFKNSPVGSESGYGIWLKANSYGTSNFQTLQNMVFEKNIMESMDGCFSILGRNDTTGAFLSPPIENLTIRNNICFDSNTAYMEGKASVYAIKVQSPVLGLTIENNTFQHTMKGFMYFEQTTRSVTSPFSTDVKIRNNIFRKESYGIFTVNCVQLNLTECFTESTNGASELTGNVIGGPTSTVPAGNTQVAYTDYEGTANFTNYQHTGGTAADFALKATSPWKGTAVGGGDPGANIAVILSATTGVATGALEGSGSSTPPNITTTSPLPGATQGTVYSQTLTVTDGTSPYTWSVNTGSTLPTGLTLSSAGVLSGTPTVTGTYNFTIKVTDSTATTPLTDTQAFQLVIAPATSTLNITTTTLSAAEVASIVDVNLAASGGTTPYVWSLNTGSTLPSWLTLDNAGRLSGVPEATGTFNFTVKVTDNAAVTDTQALSLVVNRETMTCSRSQRYRAGGLTFENSTFRRVTQPVAASPDCAMKGDRWINPATGAEYIATESNPLTWSVTNSLTDLQIDNLVVLTESAPPSVGDVIVGTTEGWARTAASALSGLSASAITSGTIDPDRLPSGIGGGGGSRTFMFISGSSNYSWVMPTTAGQYSSSNDTFADLTGLTECRLFARAVTVADGKFWVRYSTDLNTTTTDLGTTTQTPQIDLSGSSLGAFYVGSWTPIVSGAKTFVRLGFWGVSPSGATNGTMRNVGMVCR